jgi:hypothetical protein
VHNPKGTPLWTQAYLSSSSCSSPPCRSTSSPNLIGVKKRVGLVAGYDPSRVADPDGLANWVGLILFLIGIAIVLMGLGVCLFIEKTLTLILIGVALITTLVIALIVGIHKYVA